MTTTLSTSRFRNVRVPGSRRARTAGQTMVLGCVTMLTLALMLMLSFNLTNVVHEKMRLQSHSDAMAYSAAAVEARSYNYFAYTNRTEAATYVAMTTLHAYMATISLLPTIMLAGLFSFLEIMAEEFCLCLCSFPFVQLQHCVDGVEALVVAIEYATKISDKEDYVQGLDDKFNNAIERLQMMVNTIHTEQAGVTAQVAAKYTVSQGGLSAVKSYNAKFVSDNNTIVGGMTLMNYACGLEGSPLDSICNGTSKSGKDDRAKVMGDVANASRPKFDRSGPTILYPPLGTDWIPSGDGFMDIQDNEGTNLIAIFSWTAGVNDNASCGSLNQLNSASDVCASQMALEAIQWRHAAGAFLNWAHIGSDKDGGDHSYLSSDSSHDKFTGVQTEDDTSCIMQGDCFMNFRSNDQYDKDYGQPSAYASVNQDLNVRKNVDTRAPWQLNDSHQLNWSDGSRGTGTLDFIARKPGKAISKAKVYFHRFDSWQMPPTMFDPYWRAKLHPFKKQEALEILGATGDTDGAMIAGAAGIEGDTGDVQ